MKRITVLRMLKKRLAECKRSIQVSYDYADNSQVYGIDVSEECEKHRELMNRDIDQLEYLIGCLKSRNNEQIP